MVELAQKEGVGALMGGELRGGSSDHANFRGVGIPVLMFTSQEFSRIHSVNDTLEHIDPVLSRDTVHLRYICFGCPTLSIKAYNGASRR